MRFSTISVLATLIITVLGVAIPSPVQAAGLIPARDSESSYTLRVRADDATAVDDGRGGYNRRAEAGDDGRGGYNRRAEAGEDGKGGYNRRAEDGEDGRGGYN
ncbi:uncharacterized protein PAC_12855 [Phialocephala subalpina]|uniref:Uncharacterized protein n=1 Tax=Phialocephala subalpina TaxID=576137 RepID=A0A1L7XD67_9HELO|nr:uncharacterized protein PAC_12855 [Phialocephala subalpina]